jgi:hypothetical protein
MTRTALFYVVFSTLLMSFWGLPRTLAGEEPDAGTAAAAQIPAPTVFSSEHRGRLNGRQLEYRVRAGETCLHDEAWQPALMRGRLPVLNKSDK